MKAILMAAGMGTRIATKTNEPKCLLDIGNGPLIRHTVELLLQNHIEVCIALGFKGDLIREALRAYPVTFYENPFYKVTNYQLWWENTLYSMIGYKQIPVQDIAGYYWSEIDVLQDYENILQYVCTHPCLLHTESSAVLQEAGSEAKQLKLYDHKAL